MLGDNLPTEWTRRMFWLCMMNGAAGHTYGANGIWQVNRRGDPHGASPHGGNYGKIPWDEAMKLAGSEQVGFGKRLLEQYPWQKFQPHPEWAEFRKQSLLSLEGCQWIWFPEGKPAQNAPAEKRFFRKTFVLPDGKAIKSAQLRASADDRFEAWFNGAVAGSSNQGPETWRTARQFDTLAPLLKTGTNVLVIVAENLPANGANPAGLIARMEIRLSENETVRFVTDSSWRCAKSSAPGWNKLSFNDETWASAMTVADYGGGPWGKIETPNDSNVYGPQSAGIPDVVRIIYVPHHDSIVVLNLGRKEEYAAFYFDPVNGGRTKVSAAVEADDEGSWTCPPPGGLDHDWVLIIESPGSKAQSRQ
jgi:hypothetical protein